MSGHGYTHKVHKSNMGSIILIARLSHIEDINNLILKLIVEIMPILPITLSNKSTWWWKIIRLITNTRSSSMGYMLVGFLKREGGKWARL